MRSRLAWHFQSEKGKKEPQMNNKGQGMTEYMIILMLVAITCIATMKAVGSGINARLDDARKKINENIRL